MFRGLRACRSLGYSTKVVSRFNSAIGIGPKDPNVRSFSKSDPDVGTGTVGVPACGDVGKAQVRVENGKIVDACFKTFGCGSAVAAMSFAAEHVKGKSLDEALALTNQHIARELALPPVKLHCSLLAQDAIQAAIADYRKKSASATRVRPAAVAEPAAAAAAP